MGIERIDIKRVDEELANTVSKILVDNIDIKTTTKAVRFACLEYHKQKEYIKILESNLDKAEMSLEKQKSKNKKYKEYFKMQSELLGTTKS